MELRLDLPFSANNTSLVTWRQSILYPAKGLVICSKCDYMSENRSTYCTIS